MGLIPEEVIGQVLDRSDIVGTVASYIPLKRAGRNFKTCCPFHNEKTPSFVVNPDKQIFHCFGCGVGGSVVTFIMKQERVEFPEALRMLASKVGVEVPTTTPRDSQTLSLKEALYKTNNLATQLFHENLISSTHPSAVSARDYLKNREVTLETVKKLKLGFALDQWENLMCFLKGKNISLSFMEKAGLIVPKERRDGFYDRFRNRIIFPIFDVKLRCIGFGARAMKEGIAKYINSPETIVYTKGNHLYGLHLAKGAIPAKDFVIVVEGYTDFIIPHQAGIENIVASLGTALTIEQIRLLRRYTKNLVMLFDTDKAGESAMVKSLDLLIEEGMNIKVATLAVGEDPDSFIRKFGVNKFAARVNEAKPLFDYKLKVLMSQYSHKTVEGKEKISSEMLPTIAKFKNAVVKFSYIKQLAEAISVSEEALILELQKVPKRPIDRTVQAPKKPIVRGRLSTVERELLKLVLRDETSISVVKEHVTLSDFQDGEVKSVMMHMFDLTQDGQELSVQTLMSRIEDQGTVRMLSELAAAEHPVIINKEKMLQDYIKSLKKNRLKRQLKDLGQQIKLAEDSGDQIKLDEYRQRYNQLLKRGKG